MHGGSVCATSEGPGQGAQFTVRLPMAAVLPERLEQAEPPQEAAAFAGRVLVADDNRDAAESLVLLLEMDGHDVQAAFDGEAALAAVEKLRPHVALLDIGMPRLNGYDVARRIRAHAWGKQIYLVAITGWGQQADKRRAWDAGFDAHLVKPVPPEDIDRLLATVSGPRGSATDGLASVHSLRSRDA